MPKFNPEDRERDNETNDEATEFLERKRRKKKKKRTFIIDNHDGMKKVRNLP